MARISRRSLIAGAALVPVAGVGLRQALAQDDEMATPGASPDASPMASPGASPMASPAAGANHVVEMNDALKFDPEDLTINVGDTVTWTTVGAAPHTSTADPDQALDSDFVKLPEGAETWDSGIVNSGESWSHTFEVPGEYVYFCTPHQTAGMVASLTVKE